jgi:hypothetical protein
MSALRRSSCGSSRTLESLARCRATPRRGAVPDGVPPLRVKPRTRRVLIDRYVRRTAISATHCSAACGWMADDDPVGWRRDRGSALLAVLRYQGWANTFSVGPSAPSRASHLPTRAAQVRLRSSLRACTRSRNQAGWLPQLSWPMTISGAYSWPSCHARSRRRCCPVESQMCRARSSEPIYFYIVWRWPRAERAEAEFALSAAERAQLLRWSHVESARLRCGRRSCWRAQSRARCMSGWPPTWA